MAFTPFFRHFPKPHAARKPHSSVFYRTRVMIDQSFTSENRHFRCSTLTLILWPSYTKDTYFMESGDAQDVQIWTSRVKAFESSDRQRDRQADTTETIYCFAGGQKLLYKIWHLKVTLKFRYEVAGKCVQSSAALLRQSWHMMWRELRGLCNVRRKAGWKREA